MDRLSAERPEVIAPGMAHTVGLCRGLPSILIHQHFGDVETRVIERSAETGILPEQCYEELLGMPYSKLAIALLEKTGLPAVVMNPLREYFVSGSARPTLARTPLSAMLRVSSEFANGLMLGPRATDEFAPFEHSLLGFGGSRTDVGPIDADEFCASVALATGTTAGLTAEQSDALSSPLIPRRPVRVAYFRDPAFSNLDPVEAMLRLSTSGVVTIDSAEEVPDALTTCRALVVATGRRDPVRPFAALRVAHEAGMPILMLGSTVPNADGAKRDVGGALLSATYKPLRTNAIALVKFLDTAIETSQAA
jgi:hypothetical protein